VGKFIVRNGELEGRKFRLEPGARITIGRELGDLNFPDKRMSRRHCVLESREDGDYIQDLGSTNGTWVNNERVKEAILKPGDLIRLGFTELEFLGMPLSPGGQAPAAPATAGLVANPNQTIAFRRSDLALASSSGGASAARTAGAERETEATRAERRQFRQKGRLQAAKHAAMGRSKQLISAKGKFCEACGEAIFMREGAPDEGTVRDGLYLCKMCALIAEKQRGLGGDYLPSYAKIVGGRISSPKASERKKPLTEAADESSPAPVITEIEELDLEKLTGAPAEGSAQPGVGAAAGPPPGPGVGEAGATAPAGTAQGGGEAASVPPPVAGAGARTDEPAGSSPGPAPSAAEGQAPPRKVQGVPAGLAVVSVETMDLYSASEPPGTGEVPAQGRASGAEEAQGEPRPAGETGAEAASGPPGGGESHDDAEKTDRQPPGGEPAGPRGVQKGTGKPQGGEPGTPHSADSARAGVQGDAAG